MLIDSSRFRFYLRGITYQTLDHRTVTIYMYIIPRKSARTVKSQIVKSEKRHHEARQSGGGEELEAKDSEQVSSHEMRCSAIMECNRSQSLPGG